MKNSHMIALLFREKALEDRKSYFISGLNFYWDMIEIPWMIVVILFIVDLLYGEIKTSQERKVESLTIAKENGNRLLSIVYAIEFPSHSFLSVKNLDHIVIKPKNRQRKVRWIPRWVPATNFLLSRDTFENNRTALFSECMYNIYTMCVW